MTVTRMLLGAISGALSELPRNSNLWSYVIRGFDGSPYITRTLLPRALGHRLMIHKIWRADADRWLHNHPWRTAKFLVATGGYTERRLVDGRTVHRRLGPGDLNELDASTFHRIDHVEPNTWTIGLIGERCQDWGFLVEGEFVESSVYFTRHQYTSHGGAS